MNRHKIINPEDAAALILDNDTIITGGFVGIGFPEELAIAIEKRFLETGSPNHLTMVYAAGQGDGKTRGLNHFAHKKMVKKVIGGHWGLVPGLGNMAIANEIEAYNFPQGAISHLFRDIAANKPGTITKVGLHTFVDPRLQGGKLNERTTEDLVKLMEVEGEEYLFYKSFPVNIALLRGTTSDEEGNISMEKEALSLESLAIAQAVKNSGGIVIVQVERVTINHRINPQMVVIPGVLVDGVVISKPENHAQTFSEQYNPAYTGEVTIPKTEISVMPLNERKVIARRATQFLKINSVVNLGIGMPEGVASVANEENILDYIIPTVEPGGVGGIPAGGLSFGAVANAHAVISQPSQFDFYDGGGLDQAFLGMAQVDAKGNVNVSRFGPKIAGAGGFINISQNAKAVYFMGTFKAGAKLEVKEGKVNILQEGKHYKFIKEVEQITFNGEYAYKKGQTVFYITERGMFKLVAKGLELVEIVKGMDLEKDILSQMEFKPQIAENLKEMDERIFKNDLMKLRKDESISLEDRILYEEKENTVYLNMEGLNIYSEKDVQELAKLFEQYFSSLKKQPCLVVNYDNFYLAKEAEESYFDMVQNQKSKYFISSTRYSTKAFFRRLEGTRFDKINAKLYTNSQEALEHLKD